MTFTPRSYSSVVRHPSPQPAGCVLVQQVMCRGRWPGQDVGEAQVFATLADAHAWILGHRNAGPGGCPRRTRGSHFSVEETWSQLRYNADNVCVGVMEYRVLG